MDLTGVGRLLTNNDEANALACKHFKDELGSINVFQLPPASGPRGGEQFSRPLYAALEQGGKIRVTPLTEQCTWDAFRQRHGDGALPPMMFRKNAVIVATVNFPLAPLPGRSVVSLFFPAQENREAT